MKQVELFYGLDVLEGLSKLPDESVHCVVTSPPYWGLRDYGVAGQIGLEDTPWEWLEKMTAVFREVRRVLREDGTLWLNIGDTYNAQAGQQNLRQSIATKRGGAVKCSKTIFRMKKPMPAGIKRKELIGIPWRLALALQADGWYLRSDIIWSKPNPMPESVTDRPTKAHEYIFLMTKSPKYFYNADAIREECKDPEDDVRRISQQNKENKSFPDSRRNGIRRKSWHDHKDDLKQGNRIGAKENHPLGRNKRTVWQIATQAYPEAHFATFPEELPRLCVSAGCPQGGGSARSVFWFRYGREGGRGSWASVHRN